MLILFGSMGAYITACIWLLYSLGCWKTDNLKSTLAWAFGFGLISLFRTSEVEPESGFFRKTSRESIGINVFIEFLIGNYAFNLVIELILVPLATLASVIVVIADRIPRSELTKKAFSNLLTFLGLAVLINAGYHAIHDFKEFANLKNLREFFAPILLTLLYIPYLYFWHVFLAYDKAKSRLRSSIKDESLRKYASRRSLAEFRLDIKGLHQWLRHTSLFRPNDINDVNASFAEIKKMRKRQKNPFRVTPEIGWLPEHASTFLSDVKLKTKEYHRTYDGWSASSPYFNLGKSVLDNNIAYYITGDEWTVTKLDLVLNVNCPDEEKPALDVFESIASKLISRAAYGYTSEETNFSLESDGMVRQFGKVFITLRKDEWAIREHGYELTLKIEA